ncbi:MAG: hypothetical protein OXH13_05730 [Chloroflexi bacterium]|nr:hypothetical protein [Chloroflexota bacterium]MCY3696309.1 hypothetical protein [Chloroflexota bacterium]MXX79991.1 endonuclease/exonuclease/phosphatase family protein [Chloroflexota bacterium]MYF23076.1 endonuclease/exonuclease/phosphatase family protein [Chloroflexota bacterium]
MKIISWNMQNKKDSWRFLVDRHQEFDFAFVGEACVPPLGAKRDADAAGWNIPYETWDLQPGERRRQYRQEVLGIRQGWSIERLDRHEVVEAAEPPLPSNHDRIFRRWHRVAIVSNADEQYCLICVVSGHGQAQSLPLLIGGVRATLKRQGYSAAMPTIVAGDLTTSEHYSPEMFARMSEIGLPWAGPCGANYIHVVGRKRHQRETPETAHRRLNHVFVSAELADRATVTALNDPDEDSDAFWGPSDHCRISIEVSP